MVLLALVLSGCATPAERIDAYARAQGYERIEITAGPGQVVGFFNAAAQQLRRTRTPDTATLHVYLEGDGVPWVNASQVSTDPTPREPLALHLMQHDASPAVYITRPCAHGNASAEGCSPLLWTHARYGVAVVERMTSAVRRVLADVYLSRAVLIGYSGGGTLAMLIASQLEQVHGVVTVAANLDIDMWTRFHDYSPLAGSMNPALQPALPERVFQLHLAGGRDANIPLTMLSTAAMSQPEAELLVFEDFDHACCWVSAWPEVLNKLARMEDAR